MSSIDGAEGEFGRGRFVSSEQSGKDNVNESKQGIVGKGQLTRIAASMRESGEAVVAGLGITAGMKVLDFGMRRRDDGPPGGQARRPHVLGVDIASNLVAAGNRHAQQEGLTNCRFQEGDATNLNELEDRRFDLVVSIFGAMFARKPFDVAREMVRVTRTGGPIMMGNWIPRRSDARGADPENQLLPTRRHRPEGFISPMTWGIESNVVERFGAAGIAKGESLVRTGIPTRSSSPRRAGRFLADLQDLLRAHDECICRRGTERQGRGPFRRSPKNSSSRQNKSIVPERHVDSRELPARHSRLLSGLTSTTHDAVQCSKEAHGQVLAVSIAHSNRSRSSLVNACRSGSSGGIRHEPFGARSPHGALFSA